MLKNDLKSVKINQNSLKFIKTSLKMLKND